MSGEQQFQVVLFASPVLEATVGIGDAVRVEQALVGKAAALQRSASQLSLIALAMFDDGKRMVEMVDGLAQSERLQQLFSGQHRVAGELLPSAAAGLPEVEGCLSRVGDSPAQLNQRIANASMVASALQGVHA